MLDYKIGVITSALGPNKHYAQAMRDASSVGFDGCQLSWISNEVELAEWFGTLADEIKENTPSNLAIYSLCIDHTKPSKKQLIDQSELAVWEKQWRDTAINYINLASFLDVPIVSEHLSKQALGVLSQDMLFSVTHYANSKRVSYVLESDEHSLDRYMGLFGYHDVSGVCFDPGNLLAAGHTNEQIVETLTTLAERQVIVQLHVKDWGAENGYDVSLGEGNLDLDGFLDAIEESGLQQLPLIIEISGNVETREERCEQSLETLRKTIEARL